MRSISRVLALASTLSFAAAANATPVTYTFTNTVLQNASGGLATVTGTLDYNFSTVNSLDDYVTATNFTVNAGGSVYSFVSSSIVPYRMPAPHDNAAEYQFNQFVNGTLSYIFTLDLEIFNNFPTPFNPNGAALCPVGGGCISFYSAADTSFFTGVSSLPYLDISGTLQTTPTPEPSTLLLLSSGVLGLAVPLRRALQRS